MTLWTFGPTSGLHAIVIGVGEYPWLAGGSKPLFSDNECMGQLTSAPVSALAFATWVANSYVSATHPLSSLEVLVSPAPPQPWRPCIKVQAQQIERATFANFRSAVLAWHARTTSADRMLLFFSGHGMGAGFQHTLVLEDYGSIPAAALGHTFDFTKFHVAMARAPALEQFYLLDACRVSSGTLMQGLGYFGDPILTPNGLLPSPARRQPILYSTMPGDAAFGRPNDTTLFTEALLRAMRGAGAARRAGTWVIRPSNLQDGLQFHLEQLAAPYGAAQYCMGSSVANFDLHELPGVPDVPVKVDCGGAINLSMATVNVTGATGSHSRPPPVPRPWIFELPVGSYGFSTLPPIGGGKREQVFPPYTEVALP